MRILLALILWAPITLILFSPLHLANVDKSRRILEMISLATCKTASQGGTEEEVWVTVSNKIFASFPPFANIAQVCEPHYLLMDFEGSQAFLCTTFQNSQNRSNWFLIFFIGSTILNFGTAKSVHSLLRVN